jgi:hypothetical protein
MFEAVFGDLAQYDRHALQINNLVSQYLPQMNEPAERHMDLNAYMRM